MAVLATRHAATALQANLFRLFSIRLIVFVCQMLALAYAYFVAAMTLDYGVILAIVALLGVVNGALYWRLKRRTEPSQREFFVHLLVDVAGLSVLLYFTGGASNPFVSYFLVPVTIAAATLAPRYTWLLSALALTCYTVLLFLFRPLEPLMPTAVTEHADHAMPGTTQAADVAASAMNLHTLGMWFNFLVSAALITYFVVKMAAELRVREERIARYREDTLRNEQIVALATQAAGTAHEMGTPLGTMAVLLQDMKQEHAADTDLAADLALLQQQVKACRDSLRNLVSKADLQNQRTARVGLRNFIDELHEQWRLVRPEVSCRVAWPDAVDVAPEVDVDPTLQQALINMLNNAADASPSGIDVTLRWDAQQWQMLIRDHGAGLSREVAGQIGTRIVSTKEGGMGVALVLSQATLNRLGGNVSLHELREGGTLTEITLPQRFAEHAS
jgi:two-component system sensor histidine kinase RegB